jgi:hypothetical protein
MTLSATTRHLILATILILVGAGLFSKLRPGSPTSGKPPSNGQAQHPESAIESALPATDFSGPLRTKSKDRIHHLKPTIEETTALLRTTMIPRVDIQDQTVLEVAATFNGVIQDAGIPPHKLRVIVNKSEDLVKWRIKELRIREVPLAVLFKYACDSTRLRYRVEPGIIRFLDAADDSLPETPTIEKSGSPIELPSDPDDPFGGSPARGADPFAEPEIPTSH